MNTDNGIFEIRTLHGFRRGRKALFAILDEDELQLYAQKIVHLKEPQAGLFAEALVRLREEEELLLPPGAFLPVFGHHRMMPQLDRWVVRHVTGPTLM